MANPIRAPKVVSIELVLDDGMIEDTYLVIVPTLSYRHFGAVVRVVIVGMVLEIRRVKRLHAQRTAKNIIGKLKGSKRMVRVEQLRGDGHCDREVRPELIVRPLSLGGCPVHVLVNAPSVDHLRIDVVLRVFAWILGQG